MSKGSPSLIFQPFSKENCIEAYTWGDNCKGWTFIDGSVSVKQELMPRGTRERKHYHEKAFQYFYVLRGEATFEIDGEIIGAGAQKLVEIKPLQKHLISNKGEEDLEFILFSNPSTSNDRINVE